jgi:hypothetical protein
VTISYTINCGTECGDVADKLQTIASDPAAGAVHAQVIIDAINAAGAAAGFENAVVDTAVNVAATFVLPPTVGITLPPSPGGADCIDSGFVNHVAAYSFNGNADDDAGSRHGIVYGATLAADRFGTANAAYYFGEQSRGDKITVSTPFSNSNSDFTISLWIAPAVVGDGTWHGFVGYQPEDGDWQVGQQSRPNTVICQLKCII